MKVGSWNYPYISMNYNTNFDYSVFSSYLYCYKTIIIYCMTYQMNKIISSVFLLLSFGSELAHIVHLHSLSWQGDNYLFFFFQMELIRYRHRHTVHSGYHVRRSRIEDHTYQSDDHSSDACDANRQGWVKYSKYNSNGI